MVATGVFVPRVSCNCLLPLWKNLQNQQLDLTQVPMKLWLLFWDPGRCEILWAPFTSEVCIFPSPLVASKSKLHWHIQKQRHYFVNKGPSSQGYGFSSGHVWMWELDCGESWVPKLMLLNCGVGEDSWESLGLQGDPTSPFWRRSALGFLWKEWC